MLRSLFLNGAFCLFACIVTLSTAEAIEWQSDRAIVLGNGCSISDSELLLNGSDVSLVASDLSVTLGLFSDSVLADSKRCALRVPVSIEEGVAIESIKQSLTYGLYKTEGARASLSASLSIADVAAPLLNVTYLPGKIEMRDREVATRIDKVSGLSLCEGHEGIFRLNVASLASIESSDEFLDLSTNEGDIRYEAGIGLKACK